jgi:hypothetical protein
MTRAVAVLWLTCVAGCSCQRESAPFDPAAGVELRPCPDDPRWLAWRDGIGDLIEASRVSIDAGNPEKARRKFAAIPRDAEPSMDPVETAKAGKRTAITSNARDALDAIEAGQFDLARTLLAEIENDPFFGK